MFISFAHAAVVGVSMAMQPGGGPGVDPSAEFQRRYHALAMEGQPATGANAMELIGPVAERIKAVTAEVMAAQFPGERPEMVDLQALTREAATPREKEIARAVLEALTRSDVPKLTAELAAAPRSVKGEGEGLLVMRLLPELGQFRQVARFQSGRMTMAQERGDSSAWFLAFEESLALSKQPAREPVLISALVGITMEALTLDAAYRYLAGGCAEPEMIRIAENLRALPRPAVERALRGESLMAIDTMEYIYDAGPAGMEALKLMGKLPPRPAQPVIPDGTALGPGMPARGEHRTLLEGYFEDLRAWARLPRAQRQSSAIAESLSKREESSLLLGILAPAYGKLGAAVDQLDSDRIGVLTVVALERYKLANGAYPQTLVELAPAFLPEAPSDPFTGGPLGYLPPAKGPYTGGRAYVLYAAGNNLRDDGGRVDLEDRYRVNKAEGDGDLLLNPYPPAKK